MILVCKGEKWGGGGGGGCLNRWSTTAEEVKPS